MTLKNENRLGETGFGGEIRELRFRPRAEMRDDLGGAQRAELGAMRHVLAAGEAIEEARGEEIAGTGGIEDLRDRRGRDFDAILAGEDFRAFLAARQHRDLGLAAHRGGGLLEILRLVERADLGLVGEEDVDMAADQVAEIGAVAIDAERIGEGEADFAAGLVGNGGRLTEGLFRRGCSSSAAHRASPG